MFILIYNEKFSFSVQGQLQLFKKKKKKDDGKGRVDLPGGRKAI